jgi:hypothetical protein
MDVMSGKCVSGVLGCGRREQERAMTEYEDGAFYWVKHQGQWTVMRHEGWIADDYWMPIGDYDGIRTEDVDEIGPCIGKTPPKKRRRVGEREDRPRTSAELDKALEILLNRP